MSDILKKILATKYVEVAAAKERVPLAELTSGAANAPPVREFVGAETLDRDEVFAGPRRAWKIGGAHTWLIQTESGSPSTASKRTNTRCPSAVGRFLPM